jgi:hypothetical protein
MNFTLRKINQVEFFPGKFKNHHTGCEGQKYYKQKPTWKLVNFQNIARA